MVHGRRVDVARLGGEMFFANFPHVVEEQLPDRDRRGGVLRIPGISTRINAVNVEYLSFNNYINFSKHLTNASHSAQNYLPGNDSFRLGFLMFRYAVSRNTSATSSVWFNKRLESS